MMHEKIAAAEGDTNSISGDHGIIADTDSLYFGTGPGTNRGTHSGNDAGLSANCSDADMAQQNLGSGAKGGDRQRFSTALARSTSLARLMPRPPTLPLKRCRPRGTPRSPRMPLSC